MKGRLGVMELKPSNGIRFTCDFALPVLVMLTIGVRVALTFAGGRHEPLALQIV